MPHSLFLDHLLQKTINCKWFPCFFEMSVNLFKSQITSLPIYGSEKSFSRIWQPCLWNVIIREDRAPSPSSCEGLGAWLLQVPSSNLKITSGYKHVRSLIFLLNNDCWLELWSLKIPNEFRMNLGPQWCHLVIYLKASCISWQCVVGWICQAIWRIKFFSDFEFS